MAEVNVVAPADPAMFVGVVNPALVEDCQPVIVPLLPVRTIFAATPLHKFWSLLIVPATIGVTVTV